MSNRPTLACDLFATLVNGLLEQADVLACSGRLALCIRVFVCLFLALPAVTLLAYHYVSWWRTKQARREERDAVVGR